MQLSFPNQSRSFDAARNAVRFWGHDGALEVAFFVDCDALRVLVPTVEEAEAGFVAAFDQARDKVYTAADRAYTRAPRGTFVIELHTTDL